MNVGSLFSGIGGIELGFKLEGFNTAWFVECEPYAQAVLRKHWPDAIIYEDVTSIDWRTVPPVDILTGGFPCQDISNAGKRAGITGRRSSLWKYHLEAIRTLRPKYILAENVSALTDRGLTVVLADLASIGYDAEWHCVPASAVGAPHRRDRIFIIAYASNAGYFRSGWQQCEKSVQKKVANLADTNSIRPSQQREPRQPVHSAQDSIRQTDRINHASWWSVEPDVGRVVDGVSARVDRIRCLGNAVVPAVAQIFAQAIKECAR